MSTKKKKGRRGADAAPQGAPSANPQPAAARGASGGRTEKSGDAQSPRPAPGGTPTQHATSPPPGRAVAGLTAATLLLLAWAFARTTSGVPAAQAEPPAAVAEVPGFLANAWFLPDDSALGFVEVPEGLFLMGSEPADTLAFENERWADGTGPASVHLPTFYVGRFEVTVAQFRAFVDATGYPASAESLAGPPDHPVTHVSWTDAIAYARWLDGELRSSARTPPALAALLRDGWNVTLPTEAQWEKAARGTDGRVYPWGNEPRPDRANYRSGAEPGALAPVGSVACPECAHGLADMAGNAWEWTRTPYLDGPHDPRKVGPDLESDALWVMRGGSYADPARNVRAALRGGADPGVRRPFIGFRLVLSR